MSKTYELLKEYDNKQVDREFLERGFELLLQEDESLKKYVSNIKVTTSDEDDKILGNFRIKDKLVTIYLNNIIKLDNYHLNNTINKNNIRALEIMKHEIVHAENIKKVDQNKKDIESNVLKPSLLNYCIEKGLYFPLKDQDIHYINFLASENYLLDPGERLAEIKAWKYIVNILKNQKRTDELLYARTNLFYSYIRGYEDNGIFINCPTYEFLLELGLMREYKQIKRKVEENKYSFDTRLTYGLPLSYFEFNYKILNKVRLQKKQDKTFYKEN